mmetsp:Transcript_2657/g.2935  ORF Transcript_2657/g.2935 Transcript_2657/m.2935 type:complete len:80 (-) Transcript_2657:220-459(-)
MSSRWGVMEVKKVEMRRARRKRVSTVLCGTKTTGSPMVPVLSTATDDLLSQSSRCVNQIVDAELKVVSVMSEKLFTATP